MQLNADRTDSLCFVENFTLIAELKTSETGVQCDSLEHEPKPSTVCLCSQLSTLALSPLKASFGISSCKLTNINN